MRTLHVRNVPDDVAEDLERRATADGVSLNDLAVKLLADGAAVARNDELFARTPDLGVDTSEIVNLIRRMRDA